MRANRRWTSRSPSMWRLVTSQLLMPELRVAPVYSQDQPRAPAPPDSLEGRRGGCRRRRAPLPRPRRREPADSPGRRSARRSPAPRRSSRSGAAGRPTAPAPSTPSAPRTPRCSARRSRRCRRRTGSRDAGPQLEPLRPGSGGAGVRAARSSVLSRSSLQCAASTRRPVSSETITIRESDRGWMRQRARRLIAAFSVCAPSWKRYSGQMSSVPPARSMRVGADASMCTVRSLYGHLLRGPGLTARGWKAHRRLTHNQHAVLSRDIRRHIGQLVMAGFAGHSIPPELRSLAREFDLGGVIFSPATSTSRSRSPRSRARRGTTRGGAAAVGQRRPGGRPRRAARRRRSPCGRRW